MRLSLQGRILLVVSLGMAVLAGAFGFLALSALRESTERALGERLILARVVANRLDLVLAQSLALLEKHSDPNPLESQDWAAAQRFLRAIHQELILTPSYVALVDGTGTVVATVPHFRELVGTKADGPAPVGAVLLTGKPAVTGVLQDPVRQREAVYLVSPVRNQRGEVTGLIQAAVDLANSNIGEFVLPLALGETGYGEVVDSNGIVLASSQHERLFEKGDHSDQFAALIRQGRTTAGACHECHTAGGGKRREVLAFAPLSSAPWGVAIRQSEEEALAPVQQLQDRMLLIGLLALLAVGSFSWMGVRRVVRPLLVLAAASRRIGEGALDAPVPQVGEEEVRILSRALEEMRQRLRASYGEMARYQEQLQDLAEQRGKGLEALVKASESLTYTTEHEALLESIVRTAVETFPGADMGVLFLYDWESGELVARSAVGYDLQALAQVRLKPGEALAGRVFELQKPLICHNPAEAAEVLENATPHNRFYLMAARRGKEPLSLVAVPLQARGEVIGSLVLGSLRHTYAFPENEVQLLSAFAAHAAIVLENARLMREASQALAFQEGSRLKSEFLSSISHELRTPLTSMKISVESLLMGKELVEDRAQVKLLLNISRNTDHLNRLVGDLIDMARLQSGAIRLNLQPLELGEVVHDSLDTMRPLIEARGQALKVKLMAPMPSVVGDRSRLKQVLVNLLTNACDYTPSGGAITVAAEERDGYIIVSVADTGPGIPLEEQQRLFERFYRGPRSERSRKGGLGLGLPIAQALVELHGGQIWLKSDVGRGSTFFFSLPKEGTPR